MSYFIYVKGKLSNISHTATISGFVRSNTRNIHPSVTPSAALQLKHRLHPHEDI